jgi:hypothetical protein
MCIACEMGFWMDDLPVTPQPGFPSARPDKSSPFACDAPEDAAPVSPAETFDGERKP